MILKGGERVKMMDRRKVINYLGLYGVWIALMALAALAAFQIQTTLVYIGLLVVENPDLRPSGWTTNTITPLERLIILILGVFWLGLAMYSEPYLREGMQQKVFRHRLIRLLVIILGIFGLSYGVLILLS
jgi:hypothetical protein